MKTKMSWIKAMKCAIAASFTLASAGCAPSLAEKLAGEWDCGSNIVLRFDTRGHFKITSTATNPAGVWEGQFAIDGRGIKTEAATAHPLDRYRHIEMISGRDMVLTDGKADKYFCRARR